ncbi:MAG: peptidase M28, partial [Lentimicrobium sp.]|nr:peptidase M28 [Lentimicrobium sp.]
MRKHILFLSLFFAVFFSASAQTGKAGADQIQTAVTYLASEELGGRKAGTEGDSLAAVFIRDKFSESGATLLE